MDIPQKSMGFALGALRRLAGLDVLDRFGLREPVERLVYRGTRGGARMAAAASRGFGQASKQLSRPARPSPVRSKDIDKTVGFDLTPTDEQQMLVDAFKTFATEKLRPAALEADEACTPPDAILTQATELGALMLSVPQELGGVVDERSAVTSVLAAEALAYGDMGLAVACLSPAAVATALALWGDADQQSTYLPTFVEEQPPAAALAIQEPRPVFDPFELGTTGRWDRGDLILNGVKALVPRAGDCELFLVAADLGGGPALVLIESGTTGLGIEQDPAMGVRAAATGRLILDDVRVPETQVLADSDPAVYAEAVHRARLAWCAVAVGTAQAVLDYVIPYVNEREAFGEPVSHRQGVAFIVSDIGIELEGMRLTTYRAAALADRDEPFAKAAAAARTLCAAKGMKIGSAGVQLLGGHGYVKEHPVERWYRDLRAAGVMEGGLLA